MQFLTPLFWIASIGIVVPVLIHLVRRERSPSFLFSSLQFLRPVTRKSFKHLKIRNPLILLLRAIFILALVAAFSRPYLPGAETSFFEAPSASATVILLDNSYSMSIGGRFTRAIQAAGDFIDRRGSQDEVALVTFSDSPSILSGLTQKHGVLKSLLESKVKQSYRTTDYIAALHTADKLLSERTGVKRSVLLISDMQKVGFRREETFRLSPGIRLEVMPIGGSEDGRVAVTDTRLDLPGRTAERKATVTARLLTLDKSRPDAEATLLLNGRKEGFRKIQFGKDSVKVAQFEDVTWPEGSVRGEIQALALGLASSFYYAADGRARDEVAVIEGPMGAKGGRRPAYYLSRALAAAEGAFTLRTFSLAQSIGLNLRGFRTIFVVGVDSLPVELAQSLKGAVQEGSGLVIACGPNLNLNTFNISFADLSPAALESAVPREREPVGVLGNIKYNHPIFKIFSDTKKGNFLTSRFHGYFAVKPSPGSQVLARFDDGNPTLVERSLGRGRVLLFCSSLDNSWNDLPLSPVYLPFVHQLVAYAGSIWPQRNWFWVGDSFAVQERASGPVGESSRVPSIYVTLPGNSDSELPLRDSVFTFEQPGFYAFRSNDRISYRAANVRPEELDFTPLNAEELVASLTVPQAAQGVDGNTPAGSEEKRTNQDFGFYLLGLALLLLVAELALANRSVRQVR